MNLTKKLYALILVLNFIYSKLDAQTLTLVKDINVGISNSFPHHFMELNNKVYFISLDGNGHKLYESDGSSVNTIQIGPSLNSFGIVRHLKKFNNKLYFSYDDGVNGIELWISDGTSTGTFLFKDILIGASSSQPENFTVCNNKLFFSAYDSNFSRKLWVTDGTISGTQQLGVVIPTPLGSSDEFICMNNYIYFVGNTGSGYNLWKSDGTATNTSLVGNIGNTSTSTSYAVLNNRFYFGKYDNTFGSELWVSDGTSLGTQMLKDVNTTATFSSDPQNFYTDGFKIYFEANDGVHGRELWVSDGTNAGTVLLKDIAIGSGSSHSGAANFKGTINYNNKVYFFGNDGTQVNMYETNGNPSNTNLIKSFTSINRVTYSYSYNGKLYFIGSTVSSGSGTEYLFVSDGTSAGTYQVSPLVSTYSDNPNGFNLLGYNNEIYLGAYYQNLGNEFCKFSATTLTATSFNMQSLNKIKIYPNPCHNFLTLEYDNNVQEIKKDIKIYNIEGKAIKDVLIEFIGNKIIVDVNILPDGYYLIKANDITLKFIKK